MEHVSETLDAFGIAWRLGATLFCVLLNAFFVATEFALVKVRVSRVEVLAREGRRRARVAQHVLQHLDRYLSACQLGITLASLVLGALGEPAVSVLLIGAGEGLGFRIDEGSPWVAVVSITLAFTVITALHMILGEQAPKMWAIRRAERTALQTAYPLRIFAWIFGPFIGAINGMSNRVLRLLGLPAGAHVDGPHTAEEIRSILSLAAHSGHISQRELELTENVFRMIEIEVRHILVPRVDVEFVSLQRSPAENLERIRQSGHSRFPLCEEGLDTIIGFVHAKDVLDRALSEGSVDLTTVAREALIVPDTMPVSGFLLELQAKQAHCAAVVDERGTMIGLAFREDALEEIVGPLGDEFDDPEQEFQTIGDNVYEVRGRMSLPEICDRLDFQLSDEEYEDEDTIGGHVTARLGRLPRRGDSVVVGPYLATVVDVARRRVQRVRFERQPEIAEAENERAREAAE